MYLWGKLQTQTKKERFSFTLVAKTNDQSNDLGTISKTRKQSHEPLRSQSAYRWFGRSLQSRFHTILFSQGENSFTYLT